MESLKKHTALFYGFSVMASVMGMISDIFLMYTPGVRFEPTAASPIEHGYLLSLNPQNILIGQNLGLLFIPFHFFGFLLILPLLNGVSLTKKIILCFLAALLLIYGLHFHGLMVPVRQILDMAVATHTESQISLWLTFFIRPLVVIVPTIFAVISLLLGWEIYKGRTLYPKCTLAVLPLTTYLVLVILYLLAIPASNALMAMGLNLTFLIFFTRSYCLLKKDGNFSG